MQSGPRIRLRTRLEADRRDSWGGPEAGEMRLRAATIVLILLNIALGTALVAPSRSVATIRRRSGALLSRRRPGGLLLPHVLLAGSILRTR